MLEPTLVQPARRSGGRTALIVVVTIAAVCGIAGLAAAVIGGALRSAADPTRTVGASPSGLNDPVRDGHSSSSW